MKKDTSKEKQIEMERDGHTITVPESKVQGRLIHGYSVIEKKAAKSAGGE